MNTNYTAENIHVFASVHTSRHEYLFDQMQWENWAEERLIKEVAFLIQKEHSQKIEEAGMVEKRIDLYVATPEVFWNIVNREAEKIAIQFMHK